MIKYVTHRSLFPLATKGRWKVAMGFTLLELLVALFVLAVGLLGLTTMQLSAIRSNAFGGRMTTAVALAQDHMEELLNQDLEASGAPFDPGTNPWPDEGWQKEVDLGTVIDPDRLGTIYSGYTISGTIRANEPIDHMATLGVRVTWPGASNPVTLTATKRR